MFAWRAPASLQVLLSWHTAFAASSGNPRSSAQLKKKKKKRKNKRKNAHDPKLHKGLFSPAKRETQSFFFCSASSGTDFMVGLKEPGFMR